MVAISFSVFKDKILSGEKRQTIRRFTEKRYKQILNADRLQLYWHQRSKDGYLLKEVKLSRIYFLAFREDENGKIRLWLKERENSLSFFPAKEWLSDYVAEMDGFDSYESMLKWFLEHYGKDEILNTTFMVIKWEDVVE